MGDLEFIEALVGALKEIFSFFDEPFRYVDGLAAHVFVSRVSQRCLLTRQADMSG